MSYQPSRFAAAAAPVLEAGEEIVAGTYAQLPGSYQREMAFGTLAGSFGNGLAGTLRLPRRFELAVTDRRILVFDRSPWTGRPSRLLAEIDLADVRRIRTAEARHGIHALVVDTHRDESLVVEVVKAGAAARVAAVVEAVERALLVGAR